MVGGDDRKLAQLVELCVRASKIPDLDIVSQMLPAGKRPPTVESMVHELEIPRTTLMRRLQELEERGAIVVDKKDRLFKYRLTSPKLQEIKSELSDLIRQIVTILGSWIIVLDLLFL